MISLKHHSKRDESTQCALFSAQRISRSIAKIVMEFFHRFRIASCGGFIILFALSPTLAATQVEKLVPRPQRSEQHHQSANNTATDWSAVFVSGLMARIDGRPFERGQIRLAQNNAGKSAFISGLQSRLKDLGLYDGPIDGRYTSETNRAWDAFTQAARLGPQATDEHIQLLNDAAAIRRARQIDFQDAIQQARARRKTQLERTEMSKCLAGGRQAAMQRFGYVSTDQISHAIEEFIRRSCREQFVPETMRGR